jgi:multidrug efflux pump subunit AcrB
MNISGLFIRRPVATTLVMLAVLLFGVMGYRLLPVSDLPNVDFPTISVSANLSGANPETMAAAVATPLERQFSTIAGIDAMTSNSTQGGTSITMQFDLSRDIDAAAQDVQAAISRVQRQLPQDMLPPSFRKVNPADAPIMFLALSSPTLSLSTLDEYAQTILASASRPFPGWRRCRSSGHKSMPCVSRSIRRRSWREASAWTRWRRRWMRETPTSPPAFCGVRIAPTPCAPTGKSRAPRSSGS